MHRPHSPPLRGLRVPCGARDPNLSLMKHRVPHRPCSSIETHFSSLSSMMSLQSKFTSIVLLVALCCSSALGQGARVPPSFCFPLRNHREQNISEPPNLSSCPHAFLIARREYDRKFNRFHCQDSVALRLGRLSPGVIWENHGSGLGPVSTLPLCSMGIHEHSSTLRTYHLKTGRA